MGADEIDVAATLRARVLRDRDDVDRRRALRHRPLRDGEVQLLAAPGRPDDRLGPRRAQDGRAAAAGLRPDARAEVGDRDGRLRELRRDVQQLHDPPGRRQDRPGRHPRARLPAAARGADGGDRPAAREGAGRRAARVRDPRRSRREWGTRASPGSSRRREALGETTLVVDPARIAEACTHLRDEEGFNFLVDITATDYLGWADGGVAGYIGTPRRARPQRAGRAGLRAPARSEAEAVLAQLPPAAHGRRARPRARPGLARRRRGGRRASSPSGRRPTGTSARPST